ncbi:MAG: glycosyltransferase family 2 protein [Pseudomonadota bacterium]
MTDSAVALSVVVPCYNEQDSLNELHRRLSEVCQAQCGTDYEIVLIDDGSKDATWATMAALTENDPNVVAVRLTRNHGHQLALSAGLEVCKGARILIIDADLQDPPELLGPMMAKMDDGAHVVYGRRISRAGETWFKRVSASMFYRLLRRLVEIDVPLDTGDFRLMSRKALDLLRQMPENHRFIRGMVTWIGLEQTPIDYERDKRFAGETNYPLRKMIGLAFDAITGFSTKPLKIASYLGFIFAFLAMLGILYTFYSLAFTNTVSGWASVMTVVLVLGSVQLLVLGVFGEYLGRLFVEAKRRPIFLIDQVVSTRDATAQDSADPQSLETRKATTMV